MNNDKVFFTVYAIASIICMMIWYYMFAGKHGYHPYVDIPYSIALGFLSGVVVVLLLLIIEEVIGCLIDTFKSLTKKHNDGNRYSGVMNASEYYICNECHQKITNEEIDRYWDWSGPHCPHCGNTGMSMFANVVEQDCPDGIQSSRSIINIIERWLKK